MLLLTALAAVWLALFCIKREQCKLDYERATSELRYELKNLDFYRKAAEARFRDIDPNDQGAQNQRLGAQIDIDRRAKEIQEQIDAVKK